MLSRLLAFLVFCLIGWHGLEEDDARRMQLRTQAAELADRVLEQGLALSRATPYIPTERIAEFNQALMRWSPQPLVLSYANEFSDPRALAFHGGYLRIIDPADAVSPLQRGLQAFLIPQSLPLRLAQSLLLLAWTGLLALLLGLARRLRERWFAAKGDAGMAGIEVPSGMPRSELLSALMQAEAENRRLREQL